jgi:hypothetical protein
MRIVSRPYTCRPFAALVASGVAEFEVCAIAIAITEYTGLTVDAGGIADAVIPINRCGIACGLGSLAGPPVGKDARARSHVTPLAMSTAIPSGRAEPSSREVPQD